MRFKYYYFLLLTVGLLMGVILAMQFRVTKEITKDTPSQERSKILSQELEEDIKEREKLQLRVYELRDSLDKALAGPELAMLKEELDWVRGRAGLTEVSGPGVEVTLKDSPNTSARAKPKYFYTS